MSKINEIIISTSNESNSNQSHLDLFFDDAKYYLKK